MWDHSILFGRKVDDFALTLRVYGSHPFCSEELDYSGVLGVSCNDPIFKI